MKTISRLKNFLNTIIIPQQHVSLNTASNSYSMRLSTFVIAIISVYLIRINIINNMVPYAIFLFVFTIATIILGISTLIIILDEFYRPNIPQYPFNLWLDRLIPILFLLSPLISILLFSPFDAWFTRLVLLIFIHIFIIIPVFHYWSSLRRWDSLDYSYLYSSWNHPRLYKHISIALIYPLLWGIYFSLSRYIRLGSTIDIYDKIFSIAIPIGIDWIIISIFLIPFYNIWIRYILWTITDIRLYIWNQLSSLLYSIHIYLLQFYLYFRPMELLFKFSFLIDTLISIHGPVYLISLDKTKSQFPWWRRLIDYLSLHTIWFIILFFISLLLEILFTGHLYYGIYSLFIFPLTKGILSCFFAYGRTNFVFDSCLSDYISVKWNNLHYPYPFWMYFADAEYYFGVEREFNQAEVEVITKEIEKSQWLLRKKVSRNVHQGLLDRRLRHRPYPFGIRLAGAMLIGIM